MKKNRQDLQSSCKIKIDYDESIRSIDLENVLSGFRMFLEYELAEKTNSNPKAFTSVTKIHGIEKGSIDISFIFDFWDLIDSAIDIYKFFDNDANTWYDYAKLIHDFINIYLEGTRNIANNKEVNFTEKKKSCIKKILNSLKNLRFITVETQRHVVTIEKDKDGKTITTIKDSTTRIQI